uniref:L-rhamnose-binding lectin ELEL-1 n=1 Tax=Echinometra lucunter TaxID=105361 RepID=ELEL_ECHLU|nr:RecName: Full=L-rhamnose-binding lectin ELEL-1 [Echinometra lucunter]
ELVSQLCLKKERVCEGSSLTISCPQKGAGISIARAIYGRTKTQVCPSDGATSNVNCKASNALNVVRDLCRGKSSCTVEASNDVFGDPCMHTYKYLELSYDCSK